MTTPAKVRSTPSAHPSSAHTPTPIPIPSKRLRKSPIGFEVPTTYKTTCIKQGIEWGNRLINNHSDYIKAIAHDANVPASNVSSVLGNLHFLQIRVIHIVKDSNNPQEFQAYAATERVTNPTELLLEKILVTRAIELDDELKKQTASAATERAMTKELDRILIIIGVSLFHEVAHLVMRSHYGKRLTPKKLTPSGSTSSEAGSYLEEKIFSGLIASIVDTQVDWKDVKATKVIQLSKEVMNLQLPTQYFFLNDSTLHAVLQGAHCDILVSAASGQTSLRSGLTAFKSNHPEDSMPSNSTLRAVTHLKKGWEVLRPLR
jgi:hypothetical protein